MTKKSPQKFNFSGTLFNSHFSSEIFRKLLETQDFGLRNPAQILEIYNKLKSSNLEGITQDEYGVFSEFISRGDFKDIFSQVFGELLKNNKKNKVDLVGDLYKNLIQSRVINILYEKKDQASSITMLGDTYKKTRDGTQKERENPLYVKIYEHQNGYSLGFSLRTHSFVLIDEESNKSVFESTQPIHFEDGKKRQQFHILFSTGGVDYIALQGNFFPISKSSELIEGKKDIKIILDPESMNLHYINDALEKIYTVHFPQTKIKKIQKEQGLMILENSEIVSSEPNFQLYDIFKKTVVENYIHSQESGFNETGFFGKTVDGKYDLQYDAHKRVLEHQESDYKK